MGNIMDPYHPFWRDRAYQHRRVYRQRSEYADVDHRRQYGASSIHSSAIDLLGKEYTGHRWCDELHVLPMHDGWARSLWASFLRGDRIVIRGRSGDYWLDLNDPRGIWWEWADEVLEDYIGEALFGGVQHYPPSRVAQAWEEGVEYGRELAMNALRGMLGCAE
jgi:hypothetical protein